MRKLTADYIFPISSKPIPNGVVIVDKEGIIIEVLESSDGLEDVEHYEGVICPGFVNTHSHLELSHLKGKIPEKSGLVGFAVALQEIRKASEEEIHEAIIRAEGEMIANGIVAVGDISNDNFTFGQKARNRIKYYTFIETLGFRPDRMDINFDRALMLYDELTVKYKLKGSVAPHAPYSISEKLFRKISDFVSGHDGILSMHNQETESENLFFKTGEGELLKLYEYFDIDISFWKPTGCNSLQSTLIYLSGQIKTLLVHNTYTKAEDIEWAENYSGKLYWCFCPNANLYIENKNPDYDLFIKAGARITIGTDSLASNWALSVLDELKTISKHAPHISLEQLLCWATKNGAEFLGFDEELGTLEKSKCPGINLIANIDISSLQLTENSSVQCLI